MHSLRDILFSQLYDSALFNTQFNGIAQKQIRS